MHFKDLPFSQKYHLFVKNVKLDGREFHKNSFFL